jgi:hypothetical protein
MNKSFQDKNGSYQFELQGRVLVCTVAGGMGLSLAKRYCNDLEAYAKALSSQPWAYVSFAIHHQAATPEAEVILKKAYLICIEHNCCADAYCLSSAMAIAQLNKIRKSCAMPFDISERMFADVATAVKTVNKEISHLVKADCE